MNLQGNFKAIIEEILKKGPVVHAITNSVTAGDCAAVALAAGAHPVMAEAPEEVEEFTAGADVLVLNLGLLSESRMESMELAAEEARKAGIPVVLDPVGVMSSDMRLAFALKLLQTGAITVVRGNFSECRALLDQETGGRGVDSTETPDQAAALRIVKEAAKEYGCIFALTGATDYVSDGKRAVMLGGGNPLMAQIPGAGCMTSVMVGICLSVAEDAMEGTALGIVIMGQAAELAAGLLETKDGPGMFRVRLIDGVYHVVNKWNLINRMDPDRVN